MKLFIQLVLLLLATGLSKTTTAAFKQAESYSSSRSTLPMVSTLVLSNPNPPAAAIKPAKVRARYGLKGKLMSLMLKSRVLKKLAGIDEPTEHQKKLGRLSLIFGAAAVVLLVIPYAALALPAAIGVLCIPSAIAGLVLGIKSVRGNTNIPGLLGLILSGSLLVLLILAFIFLALFFSGGWI